MSQDDSIQLPEPGQKDEPAGTALHVSDDCGEDGENRNPVTDISSQPQSGESVAVEAERTQADAGSDNASSDATEPVSYAEDSYYYEDEESYRTYNGKEAERIIEPVEAVTTQEVPKKDKASPAVSRKRKEKLSFGKQVGSFLSSVPFFIEALGAVTVRTVKSFFEKYGVVITFPFLLLFSAVKKLFSKIKAVFSSKPRTFSEETKGIRYELKIIRQQAKLSDAEKKPSGIKILWKYFILSFSRHSVFWKSVFNTAFPVVMIIAAVFLFGLADKKTFALEVIYNGSHIGYIEDESTFEKARSQALKLLPANVGSDTNDSLESEPVYKIRRISLNELSNQNMLCENLIENTDMALVKACGIYINGEFLCAVNNESDAVSVFNGIIAPEKAKASEDTIVAFVEEISYIQGLYPNNEETIWDSLKLKNTLNTPKTQAEYHTIRKGENAKSIAKEYSLSVKQLEALNPNTDFNKLKKGDRLLVSAETNYVRIKVMKTKVREESIPFETVKKESSSLIKGATKVSQNGSSGINRITELVTYINGEKSYSTVISEKQIKAPVNKIILIGTKSVFSGSTGSYTGSSGTISYSSGLIWPTRGAYNLSSRYGYRNPRISGWSFHGGVDIVHAGGGSTGIPVVAAASGTVIAAVSGYSGYGHTVLIDHGNGLQTRYAHMYPGSITVRVGQRVYQGQQIGRIGSTGNVTGPHLHFEVIKNGSKVNPLSYIG